LAHVGGFVQQSDETMHIQSEVGRGMTITSRLKRTHKMEAGGIGGDPSFDLPSSFTNSGGKDNLQVAESIIALLREPVQQ